MIVEKYIFLGVYKTALFWGVSLYSLTATTIIMINTRKFPVFIWVNVLLTVIAIMWFFIYMPKYTPEKALLKLKSEQQIYVDLNLVSDPVTPVVKSNITSFVKGSYRFIGKDNYDCAVVFNPYTGEYYDSYSQDSDIILPSSTITEIDRAFEDEYNLIADNDSYAKILVLSKYKKIWFKEANDIYNKLLSVLKDDNKILLINDQKAWTEKYESENNLSTSILSERYTSGNNLDLYELENSMYYARARAQKLKRIYDRIN